MHYHHYEANNDILADDDVTHLGAGDLPPPDPLLPGPINSPGPGPANPPFTTTAMSQTQ